MKWICAPLSAKTAKILTAGLALMRLWLKLWQRNLFSKPEILYTVYELPQCGSELDTL